MTAETSTTERIKHLVPIERLPAERQAVVAAAAELRQLAAGDAIYEQGDDDDLLYYLLEGAVEILWKGKRQARFDATSKAARRAFDRPGRKRHTVRAISDVVIATVSGALLAEQMEAAKLVLRGADLEVSDIAEEKSSNWMIKMLQSNLMSGLSATSIQAVFARMEKIEVAADEIVIEQNGPGDYYYVIDSGYCEVTRKIPGSKREIHLADLSPGDAFGEEAIIADTVRGASVTMLSDGYLMRLASADFKELIQAPLLKPMPVVSAIAAVQDGSTWLDLRYREDFMRRAPQDSVNMPLNVLRLQAHRLDKDRDYVVCSDSPKRSAVGAFLLLERGFRVRYIDEQISVVLSRYPGQLRSVAAGTHKNNNNERENPGSAKRTPENRTQGQATKEDKTVAEEDYMNRLESTIEKIDRLYVGKEKDLERSAKAEPNDYAHTVTGQRLADLIDDMEAQQRKLIAETGGNTEAQAESEPRVDVDVTGGYAPGEHLSHTHNPNILLVDTKVPLPVDLDLSKDPDETLLDGPADGDLIRQTFAGFERQVRACVESAVEQRAIALEEAYQDKLKRLRRAAAIEIRKRQDKLKTRFDLHYKKKELSLRKHYKKLMVLANKVTEQKAQLQSAKKQFEDKLQAANALYKEVEEMRAALKAHVDEDREENHDRAPVS